MFNKPRKSSWKRRQAPGLPVPGEAEGRAGRWQEGGAQGGQAACRGCSELTQD